MHLLINFFIFIILLFDIFHKLFKASNLICILSTSEMLQYPLVLSSSVFFLSESMFCYLIHFLALEQIISHSSLLDLNWISRMKMTSIVRMTCSMSLFSEMICWAKYSLDKNYMIVEDEEDDQNPLESWQLRRT